MSLRVGDVGKIFRLSTKFDMSGSTSLTLNFTKPDNTTLTKTAGVTAPASPVTDPDLGPLAASEYMQYTTIANDIDQPGVWKVCGIYIDGDPSNFPSAEATFTVLAGCP